MTCAVARAISSPQDVMQQFCQLDFDGARLHSTATDPIWALTIDNGEPPEEPVVLLKKFQVIRSSETGTNAEVLVSYESLGVIREGAQGPTFVREEHAGLYIFHLVNVAGEWKMSLDQMKLGPHVGVAAYGAHLKDLIRAGQPRDGLLATVSKLSD